MATDTKDNGSKTPSTGEVNFSTERIASLKQKVPQSNHDRSVFVSNTLPPPPSTSQNTDKGKDSK